MTQISHHTSDPSGPLAQALLREHHEIDAGIEAFATRAAADEACDPTQDLIAWALPLTEAMHALRRHIYLEEVVVFPKIRAGGLMMAVLVMIREHGELWRAMDALESSLATFAETTPAATPDRAVLIEGCRNMLALLDDHNLKEEPVIYPHLDTDLDGQTERLFAGFLAEGEMPEGWVCEAARA